MSRRTRSISVKAKILLDDDQAQPFLEAWEDGGSMNLIGGWGAVGWAYDIKQNNNTVFATAISPNPPYAEGDEDDEVDEMLENYKYKPNEMVFIVSESETGDEHYCVFANNKAALKKFIKDTGIQATITSPATVQQTL